MASTSRNGYCDVEISGDRITAFVTIHPPTGAGRSTTAQDVVEALRSRGVVYGFRDAEIVSAIHRAEELNQVQQRVIGAQGIIPQDGRDAQVLWKIDESIVTAPLPLRPDGEPDFFKFEAQRFVKMGQEIANVIPARPGTPGKTITAPVISVPANAGRDPLLQAGAGIRVSEDRTQFVAEADGIVELRKDRLSVRPLTLIDGDLVNPSGRYPGGVIIRGSLTSGSIKANGPVAVAGNVAGARIRANGDVFVDRAARSSILAEGAVRVNGSLIHCEVICRKQLICSEGATLVGGSYCATEGILAFHAGSPDFAETKLRAGADLLSGIRLNEIEEEIRAVERNLQTITKTLRPLGASNTSPERKEVLQKLLHQRRELEQYTRDLHSEKRNLVLATKDRPGMAIVICGTANPGVVVMLEKTSLLIEVATSHVAFQATEFGRAIGSRPLDVSAAA
jgi:uncharacterized protein (DUF342 family)